MSVQDDTKVSVQDDTKVSVQDDREREVLIHSKSLFGVSNESLTYL